MIINSYRITADSDGALEATESFFEQWRQGQESFWVDIHSFNTEELKPWLDKLNLSDLAMKCCLESGKTARFIPLKDEVFLEFPVYSQGAVSDSVNLSFLGIKNLVVTLHPVPLATVDKAIEGLLSEPMLSQPTTTALVCMLLLLESAKSLSISESMKEAVFDLDGRMDAAPDSVTADEILDQKRSVRALDTVVGAQVNCFDQIGGLNRPFLDLVAMAPQYQFAPSNVHAANQTVDRLENTVVDIRQRFDMNQQEKTNRRLAILTVLSAIFMPITFMAGIYGMNFDDMPELHFTYSYPVALLVMALMAAGMFIYFKTRGWLD